MRRLHPVMIAASCCVALFSLWLRYVEAVATPIQVVDSLHAIQDRLPGCVQPCIFQFNVETVPVTAGDSLKIGGQSLTILGRQGGTHLVCSTNVSGTGAVISITGGASTGASLSLQDLTMTQCKGVGYLLSSSSASVSLTNVHFFDNQPAVSLVHLDMSADALQALSLYRVSFEGNYLQAGAHLLDVRNVAVAAPDGTADPVTMQDLDQTIRKAACGAGMNVPRQVVLTNDTITSALNSTLVDNIMDTAYKGWVRANQLIDNGPLSSLLVRVQIDQLMLLNNTAVPAADESSLPPMPISANGTNLSTCNSRPWVNSSRHDFIRFIGVQLTAADITLIGNQLLPSVMGQYTCRSMLHLTASAVSLTGFRAENNRLVNALRVDTAVGSTNVVGSGFVNNTVDGCPVVKFEGYSVVLNGSAGVEGPVCDGMPSLAEMERLYQFWQQIALLKNQYDTPSGQVRPIGMLKMQGDLKITEDELKTRCFHARDTAGLPIDLFNSYDSMVHNKYLAYLEHGAINKALNFARSAPLTLQSVRVSSNKAKDASVFHITGSYRNGAYASTFLTINDINFTANVLIPADNDTNSVRWHSLLNVEQAFGNIHNASFLNNTNASAIVLDKSAVRASELRVVNNSALGTPLLYVGNVTATPTVHRSYVHLSNATVSGNTASGPAIVVYNGVSQFEHIEVRNNTADLIPTMWNQGVEYLLKSANGVFYTQNCFWPRFVDVVVDGNTARVNVVTLNITVFTPITRFYCQYNTGTCCHIVGIFAKDKDLDDGSDGPADMTEISSSSFIGNQGTSKQAAGLQLTNGDWLKFHIFDCNFTDNMGVEGTAGTYGGALSNVPDYSFGSDKKAAMLRMHGLNFTGNKAFAGGAIFGELTAFTLWNSTFKDNKASRIGGAIFCPLCQWDYLFNSNFEHNIAPQGGAIVIVTAHFRWVLLSGTPTMSLVANRFINNVASGKRTDPYNDFWEKCPAGGGGALCIVSTYEPGDFEHVYIQSNEFLNNTATWGGAALVNGWLAPGTPPQCLFIFYNNTITNNTVIDGAGPVLFYNNSGTVCLNCSNRDPTPLHLGFKPKGVSASPKNDTEKKEQFLLQNFIPAAPEPPISATLLTSCSQHGIDSWSANQMLGMGSYGRGDFGTFPTHMNVVFCNDDKSNCSSTRTQGPSGGMFHAKVTLVDADGVEVPNSPTNITVVVNNANGAETGLMVYKWQPMELSESNRMFSDVAFQTLMDLADDTTYSLTFVPVTSQGSMEAVALNLTVRTCYLGENLGAMHTCTQCSKGSFTLKPQIPCLPCINGANCYSEVENVTIGRGLLVPQPGFWKSSPYSPIISRCPLSGSCKVTSHAANMNRTRALLELLANQTFPLTHEQEEAFMKRQCSQGFKGRLCGSCDDGHGRTGNRCIRCLGPTANTVLLVLALVFLCLFVAMLSYNHAKAVLQTTFQTRMEPNHLVVQNHGDTLVSIIKVFVSYLQVLAIMKSVPIAWPPALLRFISNIDVTSAPEWVSLDCSLPGVDEQTKAIARTTLAMFLPVALIAVACVFWWGWSRMGSRQRRLRATGLSWTDFLVLTTIQICFTLYTFSTGATMNMFACTTVDKQQGDNTMMKLYRVHFPELGAQHYWSQNYEQRCIKGSHAIVAFLLGLPWLILFSLAFPVLSAAVLHFHRNHLMAPNILLKYGFLYQEYKDDLFAWESMIMLRKVSLLAVAIFLKPAGTVMQLTTASLLMYSCILLHELFRPYRANLVNGMERVSLFANMANIASLTFIAAGNATGLRITMTTIIFLINISVISYFLFLAFHVSALWFHQGGVLTKTVNRVAATFTKVNKSMDCMPLRKGSKSHAPSIKDDTLDQNNTGEGTSPSSGYTTVSNPVVYTHTMSSTCCAGRPHAADTKHQPGLHAFVIPEPANAHHNKDPRNLPYAATIVHQNDPPACMIPDPAHSSHSRVPHSPPSAAANVVLHTPVPTSTLPDPAHPTHNTTTMEPSPNTSAQPTLHTYVNPQVAHPGHTRESWESSVASNATTQLATPGVRAVPGAPHHGGQKETFDLPLPPASRDSLTSCSDFSYRHL